MTYDQWKLATPPRYELDEDEPDEVQSRDDFLADQADIERDER